MYFDLDIEKGLLKTVFDGDKILLESLDDRLFFLKEHKELLFIYKKALDDKEPITTSYLINKAKINESFLADIIARTPLNNPKEYLKALKELYHKRELAKLGESIAKNLESENSQEVIENIISNISFLNEAQESELKTPNDILKEFRNYEKVQALRTNKSLIGLDTGFKGLNDLTKGLKKGELCILAARPGMGKTTLALNIANHVLKDKKEVLIFSLEMSALQLFQKMSSSKTGINLERILLSSLSEHESLAFENNCKDFANERLLIYDKGSCTIKDIKATLRRLKAKGSLPDLVILDYIQLMQGDLRTGRHEQVGEISRGLKMLAMELQLPILALAQLNRQLENRQNKKPLLSDLRESGSLEQDADTILFIFRAAYYAKEKSLLSSEETELMVSKNRHGANGSCTLNFNKHLSLFEERPAYTIRESRFNDEY